MEGRFRRAGLPVALGSCAGYGIGLLLTPVITRLFDPTTFGFFSTIIAVASVFVGVSTFRLEVLAQRTESDSKARELLRLSMVTAGCWAAVLTLVAALAVLMGLLSPWLLTVGPLVWVASMQLPGTSALTRRRRYNALAWSNFAQGAGAPLGQVILGLLGLGMTALLVGFAGARLVWLKYVQLHRGSGQPSRQVWVGSRYFAAVSGGSAFVNSLASQLPVLLCSIFFGHGSVGILAMAMRIVVAPLAVVGQAAASASVGEVGRLLRAASPAVGPVVRAGMRDLLVLGLLPCGVAAALGAWLVPLALGDQWSSTGVIVAYLSLGSLAQFTVAPFSQLLNLTGHGRWLLAWDCARFLAVALCFAVTAALGAALPTTVGVYSLVLLILYTALGAMVLSAVRPGRS